MDRIPRNEGVSKIPDSQKPKREPPDRKNEKAKETASPASPPRTDRYEKGRRQRKTPRGGCILPAAVLIFFFVIISLSSP